jgi:hypothetical protein
MAKNMSCTQSTPLHNSASVTDNVVDCCIFDFSRMGAFCRKTEVLKLNMIAKIVAVGASFGQASRHYQSGKEETGMCVMGSTSIGDVANQCRIVCAINLQYLKEML